MNKPLLEIKPGVVWEPCPEIEQAQSVLKAAWAAEGQTCTVTSCHDGAHSKGSAHKQDIKDAKSQALDLRIFNLGRKLSAASAISNKAWWQHVDAFAHKLAIDLNADAKVKDIKGFFVVVIEKDHFHMEFAKTGQRPNLVAFNPTTSVYPTKEVKGFLA